MAARKSSPKKPAGKKPTRNNKPVARQAAVDRAAEKVIASSAADKRLAELDRERLEILRSRGENKRLLVTPNQRKWLNALPEFGFKPFAAATKLGLDRRSVRGWLHKPAIRRLLAIEDERWDIQHGSKMTQVMSLLDAVCSVSGADYFDDAMQNLRPPSEWTHGMHMALQEIGWDSQGRPKIKLYSRLDAVDRILKLKGLAAPERVIMQGSTDAPPVAMAVISTDDPVDAARAYQEMIRGARDA